MSLPRVSSRTPLQGYLPLPVHHNPQPNATPSTMAFVLPVAQLVAVLRPGKARYRTTFFTLAALIFVSTYLFFVQHPVLSPAIALRHKDTSAADQMALALETIRNSRLAMTAGKKHKSLLNKGEQVQLNNTQELAAISSFLASLPQNVIPPSVDPSAPIDPQLVLDFDTRSARAPEEVQAMVEDVWSRNPVFLYSKFYSPVSREIKAILGNMQLRPAPMIIDVDIRDDAEVLQPLIARVTLSPNLPVLLIGGKPFSSIAEIRALEKSGELRKLITESGAVFDGAKKKKHRK